MSIILACSCVKLYARCQGYKNFISTLIFVDHRRDPPDEPSATHNLTFSSMSDEDFFKWLRSKGISDKDCKILPGKYYV